MCVCVCVRVVCHRPPCMLKEFRFGIKKQSGRWRHYFSLPLTFTHVLRVAAVVFFDRCQRCRILQTVNHLRSETQTSQASLSRLKSSSSDSPSAVNWLLCCPFYFPSSTAESRPACICRICNQVTGSCSSMCLPPRRVQRSEKKETVTASLEKKKEAFITLKWVSGAEGAVHGQKSS